MLYPHKLLAVVDGDNQTVEQIKSIAGQWKQTLLDLYKPSPWNGVSLEACLVVAVDANPYQLSPAILPWERSARAGGYYGVMADLQSYRVQHHDIALKDRGVRMWMLEPIVIPSLSELQRWGQR